MTRKAACIGINDYPGEEHDLQGCVNDANAWAKLLTIKFGFARPDIRLILDGEASKLNILASLEKLIAGSSPGDLCVFIYSGHGTWVPDTGVKDEPDGRDEALVPREADFKKLILDDDLRTRLDRLSSGVTFVFIADSCFSGTVTRLMPAVSIERKTRFLMPPAKLLNRVSPTSPVKRRLLGQSEERMKELLLSAASPAEPAGEDTWDGMPRGVFSYFAIKTLEESSCTPTYEQWMNRIRDEISSAGFPQTPQIEGPANLKGQTVFSVPE